MSRGKPKDMTGQRFGSWTVVAFHSSSVSGWHWLVRCDCGLEQVMQGRTLRSGRSSSCRSCANRARPRAASITYKGMHIRVARLRGAAKAHTCVDCGGPASQWSYLHNDPDEVTAAHVAQNGDRITVAFSTDVRNYAARCRKDHWLFDTSHQAVAS